MNLFLDLFELPLELSYVLGFHINCNRNFFIFWALWMVKLRGWWLWDIDLDEGGVHTLGLGTEDFIDGAP